jgi:hypothetical protein
VSQTSVKTQKLTSSHLLTLPRENQQQHVFFQYTVEFVARALADPESDGFEVVFVGPVELTEDTLSVFELDDNSDDAQPAFRTHLSNIKRVKCGPLSSGHGNYQGGVMPIYGLFDRFVSERITMKMGSFYYQRLVADLKARLSRKGL